jgi:tight adherence protein C
MAVLVLLSVGVATGLVAFMILDVFFSDEQRVRRRLASLGSFGAGALADAQPLVAPFQDRVLRPVLGSLSRALAAVTPKGYTDRLRAQLIASGRPGRMDAERVLVVQTLLGIGGFAIAYVLSRVGANDVPRGLLVAAITGIVLAYLPYLLLRARMQARQLQITRQLPDMLDMLTIAVEAGLGFDQAVAKYVQAASGALAKEFGMALREIQAGKSRRDALRALGERSGTPELRAFTMAIIQADVFGVSISEVLRVQSHELRVKRRQRAEELAQKAPAKMVFPLITCIMPATLIVVIGPAVIRIAQMFMGF